MAEFTTSVDIAARPETVYRLLTTNDGMTAWMGEFADIDPRVDGAFAVNIAGHAIRGTFLDVTPHSRVVVTWGMAGSDALPPGASRVTFDLVPTASGTRVELSHAGLPDAELPGHARGWAHFTPRLRAVALGERAAPDHWTPSPATTPEGATMNAPIDTVRAYHEAWTSGDVERALTFVADTATGQFPGGPPVDKAAWGEYLAGFVPMLTGIAEVVEVIDGERVALFYLPQTATTTTALAGELFTVRDSAIQAISLVFDRMSYAPPSAAA